MKVLFLCTGNSCRSILAEAIFNHLAMQLNRSDCIAYSAGSNPTGFVHPSSIELLKSFGIKTSGLVSKSWNEIKQIPDVVITVCSSAAGEECPHFLGEAITVHWGLDDPAKIIGQPDEVRTAFENTYNLLEKGILDFFNLPEKIIDDSALLTVSLRRIAEKVFKLI